MFAKAVGKQSYTLPEYVPDNTFEGVATTGLAWLQLDIVVPTSEILAEIKNIEHLLVSHRTEYNKNVGWSSFCIHGKSYDSTKEDTHYNDSRQHTWTPEAISLMPKTVEFFKTSWPCDEYLRLRVMKLDAGAYIEVHSDGLPGRMGPVNIAITQPTECNFYIEGHGIVPFSPGTAMWLDVGHRHCVINDSNEDRYHIIVHHKKETKEFENLILRAYNKLYGI